MSKAAQFFCLILMAWHVGAGFLPQHPLGMYLLEKRAMFMGVVHVFIAGSAIKQEIIVGQIAQEGVFSRIGIKVNVNIDTMNLRLILHVILTVK